VLDGNISVKINITIQRDGLYQIMLFRLNLRGLEIIQIVAIITLNSDMWSLFTNRHGVLSETGCIFTNTVVRAADCTTL